GLTPAAIRNGRADLLRDPVIIRHAGRGVAGVVSLAGVKFTTARRAAEAAVDTVCRELGRSPRHSGTASAPLPHAGISDVEGRLVETMRATGASLERDVMDHLTSWYASEAPAVVEHGVHERLLDRVAPDSPVLACEIAYAARHADAVRLGDAV